MANNQKIADKKKADYQEGLEKSRADSALSTKPWQLHERPGEKSCTKPRKLHEGSGRVVLTVQHEAAKVTRKTWR